MKLGLPPKDVPRETVFGPVVQIAYHAPDIERAAAFFASEFGAGPFYLLRHIPLKTCAYRGAPSSFDHSSAYGQLGDVMIELIHQHDNALSAVRDMYGPDDEGLHHAAVFVSDIEQAVSKTHEAGFQCALDAITIDGVRFVMADWRDQLGFMLEFYERQPALDKFYAYVRRKAENWDGKDILRRL